MTSLFVEPLNSESEWCLGFNMLNAQFSVSTSRFVEMVVAGVSIIIIYTVLKIIVTCDLARANVMTYIRRRATLLHSVLDVRKFEVT